jgi:hypothetical protein
VRFGGSEFTGFFVGGKRHGFGVEIIPVFKRGLPRGHIEFRGFFHCGSRSHGRVIYTSNKTIREYEGSFLEDKRHGYGRMEFVDGTTYWGTFVEDEIHVCFFLSTFHFLVT